MMSSHSNTANEIIDELAHFRDWQLEKWPLARQNYEALTRVERRSFQVGALQGAFQFNPARAVSTGAKTDAASIKKRPCFLCCCNRPKEQTALKIIDGREFLLNPYPIFPLHFTIASVNHEPQDEIPIEMASMAEKLPGMAVFFNGARAGASAPDHLHCQAVMKSELPLLNYLEEEKDPAELPFEVKYFIITPDMKGMLMLDSITYISGVDAATGEKDPGLVNVFMWIGADGLLRVAVVKRSAHRPHCYSVEGADGLMVSPGAVDMAGIVILPRREDFDKITEEDIKRIYSEVGVRNYELGSRS